MIRVLVVDDQELVRSGFRLILERNGLDVVGEAGDGFEALAVAEATRPDVVIMDIRMPRLDGIEATKQLMSRPDPRPRVLALTTFDLDEHVYHAVRAGASGFLLKDVSPQDLVHAVQGVARGETMLAPVVTRRLLERFTRTPLAGVGALANGGLRERELEVARLIARGMSNKDIGTQLFLSEATIKTYVSRMLAKLDLRDRLQIAVFAYESGLVQAGEGG